MGDVNCRRPSWDPTPFVIIVILLGLGQGTVIWAAILSMLVGLLGISEQVPQQLHHYAASWSSLFLLFRHVGILGR